MTYKSVILDGGEVCSGNGVCFCGACDCSPNARGNYCQDCPVRYLPFPLAFKIITYCFKSTPLYRHALADVKSSSLASNAKCSKQDPTKKAKSATTSVLTLSILKMLFKVKIISNVLAVLK